MQQSTVPREHTPLGKISTLTGQAGLCGLIRINVKFLLEKAAVPRTPMAPMTFRESGLFKEVSNCLWLQGWTEAQGLPQLCHLHAVPTLGPGEVREELSLIFCLHVGLGVFLVVS